MSARSPVRKRRAPRRKGRRPSLRRRVARLETLEDRRLLAGDFQNPVIPEDADHNGFISVSDLTPVIVDLRTFGVPHDLIANPPAAPAPPYVDVVPPGGNDVVGIDDLLAVVSPL